MAILKKTVTLNPGESKIVTFSVTPTVAKTYYVLINGLTGNFTAIFLPFDPWSYDFNGDGYIDDSERTKATQDYFDGIITREQMLQVLNLPSPPAPPPPPPPECATQAQKDQASADWQAGLITTQELLHIQNLPLCT